MSSSHRKKRDPASHAVSSSYYTSMVSTTDLFLIFYECVDFVVGPGNHEISVQNRLAGHGLLKVTVKVLNAVFEEPVEPVHVFSTHQAVSENPTAFMVPQPQQLQFVLKSTKVNSFYDVYARNTFNPFERHFPSNLIRD